MLNRKGYLIILVCLLLQSPLHAAALIPSDELEICSSPAPECQAVSCIDQCLREGEDPLECPETCNIQAVNQIRVRDWKKILAKY